MRRLAFLLALALALLPCAALADMQRGSRGDDVIELQTLLQDTGWLFEEPDGVFGGHTEAALKQFQAFAGLPQTGVADDETVEALKRSWSSLFGRPYGGDPAYEAYTDPAPCRVLTDGDTIVLDYCAEHMDLLERADTAYRTDDPAAWRSVTDMWAEAADALYAEWIECAAPEEKLAVLSACSAWKALVDRQRAALEAAYPLEGMYVEFQMAQLIRVHVVELCGMRALRIGQ